MRSMIKVVLLLLIIYLINLLSPFIGPSIGIVVGMLGKVFVGAGLAYVTYPLVRLLKKKGIPNVLAALLTLLVFFSVFILVSVLIFPLIYQQVLAAIDVFQNSSSSITWLQNNSEIRSIIDLAAPYLESFGKTALNYIADSTQNIITRSTKFITDAIIIVCLYSYVLFDADKLIVRVKEKLVFGSKNYNFVKKLDQEFRKYLKGLIIIIVITVFEYGIIYYLIGHPDWMTLAALCAFSNLIPYFGGIIVNVIALLTAVFVSQALFIKVIVCVIVLPTIEGNLLNPMVHKHTIKVSPIILLPSLFVFSALFGFLGLVLSLPIIIVYKVGREFYGSDIIYYAKRIWNSQ